jgi:hypothetical protein
MARLFFDLFPSLSWQDKYLLISRFIFGSLVECNQCSYSRIMDDPTKQYPFLSAKQTPVMGALGRAVLLFFSLDCAIVLFAPLNRAKPLLSLGFYCTLVTLFFSS